MIEGEVASWLYRALKAHIEGLDRREYVVGVTWGPDGTLLMLTDDDERLEGWIISVTRDKEQELHDRDQDERRAKKWAAQHTLARQGKDAQGLQDEWGGIWGDCDLYPLRDWQIEVAEDDTRLGYWDWVVERIAIDEARG